MKKFLLFSLLVIGASYAANAQHHKGWGHGKKDRDCDRYERHDRRRDRWDDKHYAKHYKHYRHCDDRGVVVIPAPVPPPPRPRVIIPVPRPPRVTGVIVIGG
ncbi:hypothetical protein LX64_04923 [Chitinophaga skermanii]|uniref:Uncharacterized protein n=1 Tax=Chitinophaga skermanii TaxID=331697 RepID=A0A327Q1G9_9BACT|nr:hypothetical protein [Chitinophaga skermanii]RAI97873.1 hypothetical protein LX64_04923 [Chitinophaga skermanii]